MMKAKLPPHHYRELVNALRDTAEHYNGAQQLRARLAAVVSLYIGIEDTDPTRIPKTQAEKYQYGSGKDYPERKR